MNVLYVTLMIAVVILEEINLNYKPFVVTVTYNSLLKA